MNISALIAGIEDYTQIIKNPLDVLKFGGSVLLIGMLTVFSVLATIWGALVLFKLFFARNGKGSKKQKVEPAPVAVQVAPAQSDNAEIVAVIAAAIAMAESESNGIKFKVVSFKRR